jgi:hypothetical protein
MNALASAQRNLRWGLYLTIFVLFLLAPSAAAASEPAFTPAPGSPLSLAGSNEGYSAFSPSGGLFAVGTEMFSVGSSGALSPVSGFSPDPSARSVAFNPSGALLAAANAGSDTVSMFSVGSSGALTPVPGSPFTVGAQPGSVSFSPSGSLLAVATGESLYMFSVSAAGALTPVAGSPISASATQAVFSPAGGLLAALGSGVTMFSVSSSGALTKVLGSPFDAFGAAPSAEAFGPAGDLLAVSNFSGGVTMYSVSSSGVLAPIGSGPFDPTFQTNSVAFSPNGSTVAATQNDWSGVVAFSVAPSGALSVLPGSPFATPAPAKNVVFSASGVLATATIDSAVGVLLPSSTSSATSWVGAFGSNGYDLAGWDGQTDVSYLPDATVSLVQGSRYVWAANTSDVRALPGPDGLTRTASTYFAPSKLQVKLTFHAAYTGNLRLYAVDWDGSVGCCTERRETITVGNQSVGFASQHYGAFHQGQWVAFPVSEPAGGSVMITATREIGANAVLSGIFLGDAGAPPAIESPSAPQGNWVGTYGSAGYDLAAWNGATDLTSMPSATVSLTQGNRYVWGSSTKDIRALESPDKSTREAATYYATKQLGLTLKFNSAYTGSLHLYAVDWDSHVRRELISVGGQTAALSGDFNQGAWVTFPISAAAGETIPIVVDRTAGANAVLSGIFLE